MASNSPALSSKTSFVCLICCNTSWDLKKNTNQDDNSSNIALKIFQTFCDNLNITLEESCPYDLKKESIPFCPTCKEITRYMFHLDTQLQSLKAELTNVVTNIKGRVRKSSANFELQNLASVVDKRFSKLRKIILESNLKGIKNPNSNQGSKVNFKESTAVTNQNVSRSQQKKPNNKVDAGYSEDSRISSIQDDDDSSNVVIKQENESSDDDSNYEMDDQGENSSGEDYTPSKKSTKGSKKPKYQKYPRLSLEQYQKPTSDSGSELKSQRPSRKVKRTSDGKFSYGGFDFMEIEDGFQCCTCDNRTFKTRGGTLVHIRHFHLEEFPEHMCGQCGQVCDSPSALRNHELTHSDVRNEVCTICSKAFKNQKNLRRHLIETHKTRLTFDCSICDKKCKNKEDLDDHIQKVHSDISYCSSCGEGFDNIETMELHRKNHTGQKYFQCFYCQMNFLKHENLTKHLEEKHDLVIMN